MVHTQKSLLASFLKKCVPCVPLIQYLLREEVFHQVELIEAEQTIGGVKNSLVCARARNGTHGTQM